MTIFWFLVGCLLCGALLMVLPPLLRPKLPDTLIRADSSNLQIYRDQFREAERDLGTGLFSPEHFAQARTDIQRRLIEEAAPQVVVATPQPALRSAIGLALLILLGSVLAYLMLGDPKALTSVSPLHSVAPAQIQKMVEVLAERLKSEPNNAEGWMMLGRSYTVLQRYPDAVTAFRRANALVPGNPSLLADFADVLGMAQGQRLVGEPANLIQQALASDPRHVKALALAGSVAFETRDYATARTYWERLIAVVPPESEIARSVQGSIAEARQLEGASVPAVKQPVAAAGLSIKGEVTVSPALMERASPGDTLFIFARAVQGPRMPLAISRQSVGAWPSSFILDDSMAMAANVKLSSYAQVVVGVRISKSGNAMPQVGDLIGQSGPVTPGAQGLNITVDQVQQ
jgi:cytochrome c-type biogenesis protein CcmH